MTFVALGLSVALLRASTLAQERPVVPGDDRLQSASRELVRSQVGPEYMDEIYLQVTEAITTKFQAAIQPTLNRPLSENEKQRLYMFWNRKLKEIVPYARLEELLVPVIVKHLTLDEICGCGVGPEKNVALRFEGMADPFKGQTVSPGSGPASRREAGGGALAAI